MKRYRKALAHVDGMKTCTKKQNVDYSVGLEVAVGIKIGLDVPGLYATVH